MIDCRSVGKYTEVAFQYNGVTIDMGLMSEEELIELRNDLKLDLAQVEGYLPDGYTLNLQALQNKEQ